MEGCDVFFFFLLLVFMFMFAWNDLSPSGVLFENHNIRFLRLALRFYSVRLAVNLRTRESLK